MQASATSMFSVFDASVRNTLGTRSFHLANNVQLQPQRASSSGPTRSRGTSRSKTSSGMLDPDVTSTTSRTGNVAKRGKKEEYV